jgi:signal transduction histidine kinase
VLSLFQSLTSKIIYKIALLAAIIIVFIISSFAMLAYFQSQQTLLGNSINIAGKNRFLTMNVLFQTSEYLNGVFSSSSPSTSTLSSSTSHNSISKLNDAIDKLDTNLLALREGGKTSNVELKPLPSKFLDSWKIINNNWVSFKTFIAYKVVKPAQQQQQQLLLQQQPVLKTTTTTLSRNVTGATASAAAAAAKIYQSTKTELESLAANLINSSDSLVTQLGVDSAKNSLNVMLLEIFFGIMNIGVVLLIIYFVTKILKPISALTQATSEIKKGNLDVSIEQGHKGNDELSVLGESFNSMVQSIKNYITKQNQLTSELKKLNEQLKYKDQLKDEFINIAAHELRNPIQPILGLSEIIRSRKAASNNITGKGDDEEVFNVIIRNAKKLQCLSENILDVTKIESQSLILNKERFNLSDIISNTIEDCKSQIEKVGKQKSISLLYKSKNKNKNSDSEKQDIILVQADKTRLTQVVSNLISNAIKFTEKGTVTITTTTDSVVAENKQSQDVVIVSIKDTGKGIDSEILPRLFSKFATKSDKGTGIGLGLFICKSIIEAHGGKIWAENNIDGKDGKGGVGATFSFSLPISKENNILK